MTTKSCTRKLYHSCPWIPTRTVLWSQSPDQDLLSDDPVGGQHQNCVQGAGVQGELRQLLYPRHGQIISARIRPRPSDPAQVVYAKHAIAHPIREITILTVQSSITPALFVTLFQVVPISTQLAKEGML